MFYIDILNRDALERVGYPTQKPVELLDVIIKASSNEGDLVLDPFFGSGTTCVASERLNRRWIGIDINPKAGDILNNRAIDDTQQGSFFKGIVSKPVIKPLGSVT